MDTTKHRPVPARIASRPREVAAWEGAPALLVERLTKSYGGTARALAGVSLSIAQGEIFGVLGPHGSGKSTLLRILAAGVRPDAGRACVLGYDVQTDGRQARRRLGCLGQLAATDPFLTCLEQTRLAARLAGLGRREAGRRAEEELAQLELLPLADARTALLSPGARKRLALACALVHRPRVLLLDEPVDDLGGDERATVWRYLRTLNREDDVTILLASRHMDDAGDLCARVLLLDGGKVVASGAPAELKAQLPHVRVVIRLVAADQAAQAAAILEHRAGVRAVYFHPDRLEVEVAGAGTAPMLLRFLEEHEIAVRELVIGRPSLEDVFFRQTGRTVGDAQRVSAVGTGAFGRR